MKCAWDRLLAILPPYLRPQLGGYRDSLQQLHLRVGRPVVLDTAAGRQTLSLRPSCEDLRFVVNTASRYSPWTSQTLRHGYIAAPGGHRIGLAGCFVTDGGTVTGLRDADALCIRVARDYEGIAPGRLCGSVLVLGPPGSGKTTMLRDLIRHCSDRLSEAVAVVDERGELFPEDCGFSCGENTDVLSFCPKTHGIIMALRTLGAERIALDEITAREDAAALLDAANCGVRFLATAHARDMEDLLARPLYRRLWERRLFDTVLTMRPDKSCCIERMALCK